jgi:hypothetical protein
MLRDMITKRGERFKSLEDRVSNLESRIISLEEDQHDRELVAQIESEDNAH